MLFRKLSGVLAVSVALAAAAPSDPDGLFGLYYGPNFAWGVMGNTPLFWGQWFPQTVSSFSLDWIEPLGDELPYGQPLPANAAFLRMLMNFELSPYYESFSLGLGFRPFHVNPQIELKFFYTNLVYFNSNTEMALTSSGGDASIANTWRADYIFDHLWEGEWNDIDYSQSFTFGAYFDFLSKTGISIGGHFNFILVDIDTDLDGKSYDYQRNMPIFSRDYIFELSFYGHYPIGQNWALMYYCDMYKSGIARSGGSVTKESLAYGIVKAGPQFSWSERRQQLTLLGGFYARSKDRFYDGDLAEQFIVQVQFVSRLRFLGDLLN